MAGVRITKNIYGAFGNCVTLDNGLAALTASLDFGPRVLYFSLAGKENMLYNDNDKKTLGDVFDVYEGDILKLYGGHRIWISPEIMPRCYHPDNLPVSYKEIENGVILTGAVQKYNGIQMIMTIMMHPEKAAVTIENTVLNTGLWEIELAPWCITMMDKGGLSIIPVPDKKTNALPNRHITLWDYTDMTDPRVNWGKEFITLKQNADIEQAFKLGLNNEQGYALYINKGQVFVKYFEYDEEGLYPDGDCNYESYTNAACLEMETLGCLQILPPGECACITEDWELYEEGALPSPDDKTIKTLLKKYNIG